jgi:hypothetical protein
MDEATGEAGLGLRVAFDRRLKLEFHGATVTSDAAGRLRLWRRRGARLGPRGNRGCMPVFVVPETTRLPKMRASMRRLRARAPRLTVVQGPRDLRQRFPTS